ncbi:MAG TPA: ABC transporter ATP-binding protein [Candidatus Limnocylindrales bacterium]|nr:ABC transporter ATP-binding protein [Candidatus Limnocylindrales bacterium]
MILRADNIRKRFEGGWVLRDASLALDAGDVVLLTGRNGSGKTTLARVLATLLEPDSGDLRFQDKPLREARREARRAIGFVSHKALLYLGLTPMENLILFGKLAGVSAPEARAAELLERLQMAPFARTPVERFSRGMLQRVSLARAFLVRPRILLLDEPYAGLDPDGTAELNALIQESKLRGAATLVLSHDRERLGPLRTRLCVMEQGRVETA